MTSAPSSTAGASQPRMASDAELPPCHPQSRRELFWAFTLLALQGFGGVLAVVQRELVEKRRWFTRQQFVEEWAVAQIMPGPNVVNLSLMIGGRYFGLSGALSALAGILTAPLVVVLLLAVAFGSVADTVWAQRALHGMSAVSAGLIAATGIKLMGALGGNVLGWRLCGLLAGATFVSVAWLRWPLVWVLLGLGGMACLLAWLRLTPADGEVHQGDAP